MNNEKISSLYARLIEEGKKIAIANCAGGYPNRSDCTWYHGNWMLLRYLGLVSNPFWHESFYKEALGKAYSPASKVLVLATADFSMPLLCSECGVEEIDISDLCPSPLEICRRVAEIYQLKWNTYTQNVFDAPKKTYDLIINDAFLSRFMEKQEVLKSISTRLNKGGYYITTLKEGKVNTGGSLPQEVRQRFIQKAVTRYKESNCNFNDLDIEVVANTYADKMASYPVSCKNDVIDLFAQSDMDIVSVERGHVEGEFEESDYYRVVSKKN